MIDIAEGPGRDLKNIRQIGTPAEGDRIYIENAAYARVHEETYEERRVFIFMGHTECEQGVYMTFVEAACHSGKGYGVFTESAEMGNTCVVGCIP